MVHEKRRFPKNVSYITSPGWRVNNRPSGKWIHRRGLYSGAFRGSPNAVISTAGIFRFYNETGRMYLDTYHPGMSPIKIQEKGKKFENAREYRQT